MPDIEKVITPDSTLEKTRKRLKGFDINSNLHQATTDSFKLDASTGSAYAYMSGSTSVYNKFNVQQVATVKLWDKNKKKFIYENSTYGNIMTVDLTSYIVNTGFDAYAYVSVGWFVNNRENYNSLLNYTLNSPNAQYMYVSYCVDKTVHNYDKNCIFYSKLGDYTGELNCLLGNVRMKGDGGMPYDYKSWNLCLASPVWQTYNSSKREVTSSIVPPGTLVDSYLFQTIKYCNPTCIINTSVGNKYATCVKRDIDATDKFYNGEVTSKFEIGIPKKLVLLILI